MPTVTFSTTDANDGTGFMQKASWPPSGGTWTDYTGGNIWASKTLGAGPVYTQDIAFMRWDTSTIPDDATITAAVLQIYVASVANVLDNFTLVGDYYDFGGEPTVIGDWIETSSPSIFTAIPHTGFTTPAVNNITLTNLTGINQTGFTGIRLTCGAGTPFNSTVYEFADSESANQEPRLEVTYTEAIFTDEAALRTAHTPVTWRT